MLEGVCLLLRWRTHAESAHAYGMKEQERNGAAHCAVIGGTSSKVRVGTIRML